MSAFSVLRAAAEEPSRSALVVDGRALTYAALVPAVVRALRWLDERGLLRAAAPVALVATNRLRTVVMLYALMEAGVPVVMVHARLTQAERARLLLDCRPAGVVEDDWAPGDEALLSPHGLPGPRLPLLSDDERPLAILYTSGTAGTPKGAVLSRRALVAAAEGSAANLGWWEHDRWLLCMPLGHVGGLSIVTRCLLARRCVVLPQLLRFEPAVLAEVVARDRVTLLSVVPTMLRRLLDLQPEWQPPGYLRVILLGGAAASPRLLEDARRLGVPVLPTYGLTEACSQVATARLQSGGRPGSGGVGPPVSGMEVRIVGGEIQVRGPALFSGYYPRDVHGDPFLPGGWLGTGDLGYLDERGELHVQARRTDLIVTGGENVYPAEVEAVLERAPGVAAACVFGVADEVWGQIVAAVVVPSERATDERRSAALRAIDRRALFLHCLAELAPHKRPRLLAVVPALQVTPAGKLDRAATAAAAWPELAALT